KVYCVMDADPLVADAKRVLKWLETRKVDLVDLVDGCLRVSVSEVRKNAWNGENRPVAKVVEEVLHFLTTHLYLRPLSDSPCGKAGRKPSPAFLVNPLLFSLGKESTESTK